MNPITVKDSASEFVTLYEKISTLSRAQRIESKLGEGYVLTKTIVIQNPFGLHARPCTFFTEKAMNFSCTIHLTKGDARINAKSVLAVMSLELVKGNEVTLEVDGEREEEALEELGRLLTDIYDNEEEGYP